MAVLNASLVALGNAYDGSSTDLSLDEIGGSGADINLVDDFERPSALADITGTALPSPSTLYTYQCLWASAKSAGFHRIERNLAHWTWIVFDVSVTFGTKALTTSGNDGCTQQITFDATGTATIQCTYDDGFNTSVFDEYVVEVG